MTLRALAAFRQEAVEYLRQNRDLISIHFLGELYTIRIPEEDSPDGAWTSTLKFKNDVLSFASCDCPDGDCCPHLMIAYLVAHDPKGWLLLHNKFASSFWYHLFAQLFHDKAVLRAEGDCVYSLTSSEISLEIKALSSQAFMQWLPVLHEDSSSCHAESFLQSHLYVLARSFFLLFTQGAQLDIQENSQGFPSKFHFQWEGITVQGELLTFPILEKLFSKIDFSCTNLLDHAEAFSVSSVQILPEDACLTFTKTYAFPTDLDNHSVTHIGPIQYFSGIQKVTFPPEKVKVPLHIVSLLPKDLQTKLFAQLPYEGEEQQIRYTIALLRDASISFSAYLRTPGDLTEDSIIYPTFCYSPELGLVAVTGLLSSQQSFTIKAEQVEEFLNERGELIKEPGFQVFTEGSPEGQLVYHVTEQGVLLFSYDTGNSATMELHYGPWTYYSGQGFFLQKKQNLPIQDGVTIAEPNVSNFIKENETALRALPNFFAPAPALKNIVFEVRKNLKNSSLDLQPIFEGLEDCSCRLFGEFFYRENLGFTPLPTSLLSVSTFPKQVPAEEVPHFISQHAHNTALRFIDPQTRPPESLELIILSIKRPHPSSPLFLELELKTSIGSIPLGTVLQGIKSKKAFLFTPAGFLNLEDCLYLFLKQFISNQACHIADNTLIATITDIFKLDALAPLSVSEHVDASAEDLAFFNQLKDTCLPPIPHNLFSVDHQLRPYQNIGLLWLWFLYNHHLSGLLCDEMGLGKTHQATAFLDIVFQSAQAEGQKPKFLIVCPTSVLPHWEKILDSHLPTARVFSFHGPNKPAVLPDFDILITSYGTLRQNYKKFYAQSFTISVFDEIHMAKNKTSQIHKILCRLDSQMKLGLTGTPVENNLLEFKGLLDIILPNYLSPENLFKKLFAQKNHSEMSEEVLAAQDLLLKLTRPFILRRTKKLVLPELPDKVESLVPCKLSAEQEQLYLSTLQKEKPHLDSLHATEQASVNYLHVFALLNRLKQICDHPAIFYKTPEKYKEHNSGKWDAFVKLLQESLASGYKVVVFSQYVHMLHIIAQYLEEIGVKYALIQGKSLNRKEEIENFASDPECKVFIGSLLAAGTGINLTAGNVVIMYDRWWNPAKENQALDRVHRIGQKNTVFIYKMITEDTLEERIHYLIEKKMQLLDQVISTQDTNILHMLNREDLLTILSYKEP